MRGLRALQFADASRPVALLEPHGQGRQFPLRFPSPRWGMRRGRSSQPLVGPEEAHTVQGPRPPALRTPGVGQAGRRPELTLHPQESWCSASLGLSFPTCTTDAASPCLEVSARAPACIWGGALPSHGSYCYQQHHYQNLIRGTQVANREHPWPEAAPRWDRATCQESFSPPSGASCCCRVAPVPTSRCPGGCPA